MGVVLPPFCNLLKNRKLKPRCYEIKQAARPNQSRAVVQILTKTLLGFELGLYLDLKYIPVYVRSSMTQIRTGVG